MEDYIDRELILLAARAFSDTRKDPNKKWKKLKTLKLPIEKKNPQRERLVKYSEWRRAKGLYRFQP